MHSSIGPTLKRLRESAGLTQEKLATKSGVSRPYIAGIEGGSVQCGQRLDTIQRLADALDVHVSALLPERKRRGKR